MIRNKHDIPQGYGFPLSQAHRSRKNGALFYEQNQAIRQFGIKKCPKKLVISLLFCNFIVDNQLITNIYSDDYH